MRETWVVTDAELIESSLVDGASFALVFDRHCRGIHRFLRARVGAELADDLASECFAVDFPRRASSDAGVDTFKGKHGTLRIPNSVRATV